MTTRRLGRFALSLIAGCALNLLGCDDDDGSAGEDAAPVAADAAEEEPDTGVDAAQADPDMAVEESVDVGMPEEVINPNQGIVYGTDDLFPSDRVVEIELTMDPEDWDALRFQGPGLQYLAESCPAGIRPSAFSWFPAIAKIAGERVGGVEIRKKGFYGSMSPLKPSLKLKRADGEPIGELGRLTLNNDSDDRAHMNQCLLFRLFEQAGLPAPRCATASVTVNGTYLGVYTHVESIKRPFLRRVFGDDQGDLYEGQLTDFRHDYLGSFEPKNNSTDPDKGILVRLADALLLPDEALIEAVEGAVDLDAYLTSWAMSVITAYWDGYEGNLNNYYVYRTPSDDRLHFIPWGADEAFDGPFDWADEKLHDVGDMPRAVYAHGLLANRLYGIPEGRERYVARLRELLDSAWDEEAILAWIDAAEQVITPYVHPGVADRYPDRVEGVRRFVREQRGLIEAELDAGLPDWDRGLRVLACADTSRRAVGRFETTWDTLDEDPLNTGSGEVEELVDGVSTRAALVRSLAGPAERGTFARVQVGFGPLDNGQFGFVDIQMPMELFRPGTVQLDNGQAGAVYAFVDIGSGETRLFGFVLSGSITFEATGTAPGAPIRGTMDVPASSIVWDTSDPREAAP